MPQRGPGIAVLEMLRSDELQKQFSAGTGQLVPPLRHQSDPFPDPGPSLGYYLENFNTSLHHLLDSSPLVSSGGTVPLLRSSFQTDTFSSPNSQPQLPMPSLLRQQENQQQLSQIMNSSSLHPVPGACLRMEMEHPSIQGRYGTVNAASWAAQQMKAPQIAGMKRPYPFQLDASKNQKLAFPEPMQLPHQNYDAKAINETQELNTDWLIDNSLSLGNIGGNLNINHPTDERNVASDDGSAINLRKTKESAGIKTSGTLYNFMGLHNADYVVDQHVIANQIKRSFEDSDVVDVELKL